MGSRTRWIVALAAALGVAAWLLLHQERARQPEAPLASAVEVAAASPAELREAAPEAEEVAATREAVDPTSKAPPPTRRRKRPIAPQKPNEGLLRISVVARETQEPLAGMNLMLLGFDNHSHLVRGNSRGRPNEALETDASGRAEFLVPENVAYQLWVNIESTLASSEQIQVPALLAGEERELAVELVTLLDEQAWLRVVDGETESPVSGAVVSVFDLPRTLPASDADGRVVLETAHWRHERVRVEKEGYATVMRSLGKGTSASNPFEIPLLRVATLEARVTDSSGKPLEGIHVHASQDDDWLVAEQAHEAQTDANGNCKLTELTPRTEVHLELKRDASPTSKPFQRGVQDEIVLEPGERRVWTGTLWEGARVTGSVVDESGAPKREFEVWLLPEELRYEFGTYVDDGVFERGQAFRSVSDESGRFTFETVSPGRWWAGPRWSASDEAEDAPVSSPIAIRIGREEQAPVTLTVHRGLYIRGSVVRPDGSDYAPSSSMNCLVTAQSPAFYAHAYADAKGRFTIGPLLQGEYRLKASGGADFADSEPTNASAGSEDVVVKLRDGWNLPIKVVDAMGRGVAGANIALHSSNDSWSCGSTTGETGDYWVQRLVPGTYYVVASTDAGLAGWIKDVRVEASTAPEEQVVRLEPGARVRLRAQGGPPGSLYCQFLLDGRVVGATSLRRSAQKIVVPPGRIEVHFARMEEDDPPPPELRIVELAPGEERELVIDLSGPK